MPRLPAISLPALLGFLVLLAAGIGARVSSAEPIKGFGFDEAVYRHYVEAVGEKGWTCYPALVREFLTIQQTSDDGLPAPTRLTLLLAASAWHGLFGTSALESLHAVCCAASITALLVAVAFVFRAKGAGFALAFLALFAFSPMQLYLAHRALADGFTVLFCLTGLWSLWEIFAQSSLRMGWGALYGASLALLILSKENAAFPCLAFLALVVTAPFLRLGITGWPLLLLTALAPLAGIFLLAVFAGGWSALEQVYVLEAAKAVSAPYNIAAQSGPWFRYLIDHLMVNPVVTLLAIGGAFGLNQKEKAGIFLLLFLAVS